MTKNMTLFSRLTRDFDTNAVLIILENLPFYKNSTMTVKELKSLAAKLLYIAVEAEKGDAGEFKDGGQIEEYFTVSSYEDTLIFQDDEDNFQDLDE